MEERINLKPCLIVLSGVPLSGKSFLAQRLVRDFNLEHLDIDVVRDEIDESRTEDSEIRMLDESSEREIMIRSYAELCARAEASVVSGSPMVITGTFSRNEFKEPLRVLVKNLKELNIPLKTFLLNVPGQEVLKRIEERRLQGSFSNIDSLEKYEWAKGLFSSIDFTKFVEIDTSENDYFLQLTKHLEGLKI